MPNNPLGKIYSDSRGENWSSSVEEATGYPKHSLTPIFKIKGQGSVHESITEAAASNAQVPFDASLKKGVRWPDVPSKEPGETNYPGLIEMDKPGTITFESHNGSKQFWHSMTPAGRAYKNCEVLEKIVDQAVQWYDLARKEKDTFHIGKILHMVQDSYSDSHTIRTKSGAIVTFQSYDKQDAHRHGIADRIPEEGSWRDTPGTLSALKASTHILELYKRGASSAELASYLRKEVYFFANGPIHQSTQDATAGGSDPKYAPRNQSPDHVKSRVRALLESSSLQVADEHRAGMVRSYAEDSSEDAIRKYPELVHVYARRAVLESNIGNMAPEVRTLVMARFDEVAIKNIEEERITPMQLSRESQYSEYKNEQGIS